jgi:Carboxymuconolactone decarboxylase family
MTSKKADFLTFYRDAHAVECLTEREKMLIGLTVAMMRLCDPWVDRRLADARKAGMTEEELDAAVDVISAVDAGVLESLNQRIKARNKGWKNRPRRIPPPKEASLHHDVIVEYQLPSTIKSDKPLAGRKCFRPDLRALLWRCVGAIG